MIGAALVIRERRRDDAEEDTAPIEAPTIPELPELTKEIFHTASGREVYGGGGITPDLLVIPDTLGVDERDAVREFGDRYRRYQAEVPAWIPRRRSRQT